MLKIQVRFHLNFFIRFIDIWNFLCYIVYIRYYLIMKGVFLVNILTKIVAKVLAISTVFVSMLSIYVNTVYSFIVSSNGFKTLNRKYFLSFRTPFNITGDILQSCQLLR